MTNKRKKWVGLVLAIVSLTLVVSLGIGALFVRDFLKKELIALLSDTTQAACPCEFKFDSLSLSLLTLSAKATNTRIESDGITKLSFDSIEARVSLREVLERRVLITDLYFIGGSADGALPDSVLYRFVNQLMNPGSSSSTNATPWTVKLLRLTVHDSRASQSIPSGSNGDVSAEHRTLEALNLSLNLERNEEDNFELRASIDDLSIFSHLDSAAPSSVQLGGISTQIVFLEHQTVFKALDLRLGDSLLGLSGRMNDDGAVDGEVKLLFDSAETILGTLIDTSIVGSGQVGGTVSAPFVSSQISLAPNRQTRFFSGGLALGDFSYLDSSIELEYQKEGPELRIPLLQLEGADSGLALLDPFVINRDSLSGTVQFVFEHLAAEGVELSDGAIQVRVEGSPEAPRISWSGEIGAVRAAGMPSLSPVSTAGTFSEGTLLASFASSPDSGAEFKGNVNIQPGENGAKAQIAGEFAIAAFPLGPSSNLTLDGAFRVRGPLTLGELVGRGDVFISLDSSPLLSGTVELDEGQINSSLENESSGAKISSTVSFGERSEGSIRLNLDNFYLSEIFPHATCSSITGQVEYHFSLLTPQRGSGEIVLDNLIAGCPPYNLTLSRRVAIPIQNGEILPSNITLHQSSDVSEGSSTITITGRVSLEEGYSLRVGGQLHLQSLVGLAQGVDDLFGVAQIDLTVGGSIDAPEVRGDLLLEDGAFFVEAAGIELSDLSGRISASEARIEFSDFSGQINHGDFTLAGAINLVDLASSSLELRLRRGFFEPVDAATVELSADVVLGARGNIPSLSGTITVDSAEFSRELGLGTLVRAILQSALGRRAQSKAQPGAQVPEVGLDLRIRSPGNIQVSTNIALADLAVDLRVAGTSIQPIITGYVRSLSGWFRINSRLLEITSGVLQFRAGATEPVINLTGETQVSTVHGQSSLVVVEVRGPISSPVVSFTSDAGLAQREILELFTHQGSVSDMTTMSANRRSLLAILEDPDRSIFDENLFTFLPRLLRELARFDSFALEPTYSLASGAIVPNLIAARRITNRLELRGESFLFGDGGSSSLGLFYRLRRGLTAVGTIESLPEQSATALGAKLVYSAHGRFRPYLQIDISGNRSVDELTVLNGARLRESSRLNEDDVSGVSDRVERFYRNRGYFEVSAVAQCLEFDEYCRSLKITVDEGARSIVVAFRAVLASVDITSDAEHALQIVQDQLLRQPRGRQATIGLLERTRSAVVRALRNEGFISARVDVGYTDFDPKIDGALERSRRWWSEPENSQMRTLELRVSPGRPSSFLFEGNNQFTPEELLETINLFGRRQPFGSNTASILVENIRQQYRARGFRKVEVSHQRLIDPETGRLVFSIIIEEGVPVRLGSIRFEFADLPKGIDSGVLSADLRTKVEEIFSESDRAAWRQEHFDQGGLVDTSSMVNEALIELGFPHSKVALDFSISQQKQRETADVIYLITLGSRFVIDRIEVEGLPLGFKNPVQLEKPSFIPELNRGISSILTELRSAGWLSPLLQTELQLERNSNGAPVRRALLKFYPGAPTLIGGIRVEGLKEIEEQVVLNNLRFSKGEKWDLDSIDATRRALLRLGLFSQVQIDPVDGTRAGGKQELVVRVIERPLQTLEVGAGVQSEFGIQLFVQGTDRSLFGDGRSLSLRLDGYYDPTRQEIPFGIAGLRFTNPEVFRSQYSFISDLSYQRMDLSTFEYDLDRVSLASYFSRSQTPPWNLTFGHSILSDALDDVTPGAIISTLDTGTLRTSFLAASIGYDRRNNRLNPTAGYFLGLDSKLATEVIGSDSNFFELGARASYTKPFLVEENHFSVAAHSRIISAWVMGDTEEVPITQRFYLGGRTSVRGFRENSLGPKGEDGAVIGGDLSLLGNFEFRYHPNDLIQLLIFLDAGTVFLQQDDVDLDELRYSAGVGSRFLSPIGPIGLDLGFPLDERSGEPSARLSFTIGTQF